MIFERERQTMRAFCLTKIKQKKYKRMTQRLAAIREKNKYVLLEEYYKMC